MIEFVEYFVTIKFATSQSIFTKDSQISHSLNSILNSLPLMAFLKNCFIFQVDHPSVTSVQFYFYWEIITNPDLGKVLSVACIIRHTCTSSRLMHTIAFHVFC